MHSFEAKIEKMKPAFEKIASNPYVSAIRDGFHCGNADYFILKYFYVDCLCSECMGILLEQGD